RLAFEQESSEIRQALARSESYNRALEARIAVLETQAHRHEWQRQDADNRATEHIMRIQALEDRACWELYFELIRQNTNEIRWKHEGPKL
ncbi:hypothetical protein Tco_0584804, partial [Tanacetum coccineum]